MLGIWKGRIGRLLWDLFMVKKILEKFTNMLNGKIETSGKKEDEYIQRNNRSLKRYNRVLDYVKKNKKLQDTEGKISFLSIFNRNI